MANSGVVVVISGQDNTEKVFQAIEANMKRTSEQAHETENALAQLGEGAKRSLEAVGIAVGLREGIELLKEAVKGSLEFGETIAKASQKTGLQAETLSVLHYAAAITNTDFDGLTGAVTKMDKAIGQATEGNKKAQAFLQALGLNAKDLADRSDGAEIAFKKFAETLAQTENPIRRVELATGLLGKAGAEQIPMLIEVGEHFDEFKQKAQDAGVLLDSKTAAALEATNQQFADLRQRVLGASVAFTEGLTPSLTQVLSVMTGGKSTIESMTNAGAGLGKTLAFLGEVVYSTAAALEVLFGVGEALIPGLGDAARKDLAAAGDLKKQAQELHDIAFGETPAPTSKPITPPGGEHHGGEGFGGIGDEAGASKLEAARKARDAAQLKLDEQMAQLRAQLAKASQESALAQLEADHKKNLISDQDFYAKKLALEKEALDQQRQAAIDKQGEIDKSIGKLEVDAKKQGGSTAVEDQAKILELRTKRLALDGEIAKINADAAKAEIAAAQQLYELSVKQTAQADELAAKREQITGGNTTARLKQSADTFGVKRKDLVANFGEGSPEVSNADFAFSNEQGQIRAKGAEETSGLDVAGINSVRTAIGDAEARGGITTLDAQRQRIALDQQEAQALQPVLDAYRQLAQTGDLQASQKVLELQTRINELKNPVDEVSAHIRDSFDGAFESLFENLDQGTKAFENFGKSIEKILEQAAYKRFIEPLVQNGLNSLIPSANKTPGYGDPGIGGIGPVPNPGTDIGGGVVKAALGGVGKLFGIPGLSGLDKKGGGSAITITLVNSSSLPLDIGATDTQGNVDKDQVLTIIQNSFDEGGLLRSLLTGFGAGGG